MNAASKLTLRPITDTPETHAEVTRLFAACTDYFELVEGGAATPAHTDDFFHDLPPGYTSDDVMLHAVMRAEELIGVTSSLKGWNSAEKCMLGLVLLHPSARGAGIGREVVQQIEASVRDIPSMKTLRVGVVQTNTPALGFWRKMGFVETGETKTRSEFVAPIIIFEKNLR